jgi:hypothetical protein
MLEKIENILNNVGEIAQVEVWEYMFIIHLKNGDVIEIEHDTNDKLKYNYTVINKLNIRR